MFSVDCAAAPPTMLIRPVFTRPVAVTVLAEVMPLIADVRALTSVLVAGEHAANGQRAAAGAADIVRIRLDLPAEDAQAAAGRPHRGPRSAGWRSPTTACKPPMPNWSSFAGDRDASICAIQEQLAIDRGDLTAGELQQGVPLERARARLHPP